MRVFRINRFLLQIFLLVSVICELSVSSIVCAESISSDPMETKVQAAPANIMFVLDNSGSMDWEFMTPEADGKFDGESYLYSLSDNTYSGGMSGTDFLMWKSQWSGYNSIYYTPMSTYQPWPDWEKMDETQAADGTLVGSGGTSPPHEADIKSPRSNPLYNSPTLNLFDVFYANVPLRDFVVVDNNDTSPTFTTVGSWSESGLTPEFNNSSIYTSDSEAKAIFKPNIIDSGDYKIYAFWNCYTERDQNALIEIDANGDEIADASQRIDQHSSANNTPETGVCGEWLPLFGGTSYNFSVGQSGSVSIVRDASSSSGSSTTADAIAFVISGGSLSSSTVNISNAHYYMVDDANDNGVADAGEVYLVNFVWNDADSDSVVDDGEVIRNYYRVRFSSSANNHEVVQSLFPISYDATAQGTDSVPNSIQPVSVNEDGTTSYLSDIEDLQNFANWFSFYRRRELTAKAAVSRTINGLEWVNIGYYTLHSSGGVRQTVLPVQVTGENEVLVDNKDSGFSRSSSWSESGSNPEINGSSLYTGSSGKWARWTPNIPSSGDYEVFAWWNCYTNRDQKAKFSISHSGGTTVKYLNQRAAQNNSETSKNSCENASGSGCCGYWVSLGTYTFGVGNSNYVQVERHGGSTGNSTVADAVKFVGSGSATLDDTESLLSSLYSVDSDGGTPLRTALLNVGRYFDQDDGNDGNLGSSPYKSESEGGACQQAFSIAMTDGYWNSDTLTIGNQDSSAGAPYADSNSNTLADVAWMFYDDDLADSLPNEMSTNNYDNSKTQHMVTYSVSFGLHGSIDLSDIDGDGTVDSPGYADDPYFLNPSTPLPTWPDPTTSCSACPKKIDDLWHASVNGHGRFFLASDPDSLVSSLKELFKDISSRTASGASVSVNGDELSTGLVLYQSSYEAGVWTGNVSAYPIDPVSGEIVKSEDDILWQAKDTLQNQDWSSGRRIITTDFGTGDGAVFRYDSLSSVQKISLNNDPDVVDYIRGREVAGFRARTRKLGDIVHSAPLLVGSTLYTGGNDGMLHAFNADNGVERFAFVPAHVFGNLSELAATDYSHRFYVDATPSAKDLIFYNSDGTYDETVTLLVGALKKGGRGVYALNISDADSVGDGTAETTLTNMVLWEYPPVSSGLTYSFAGNQTGDGIDNDNDGEVDESDEDYSDGLDNNGDGAIDEEGEQWFNFGDADIGYTFSDPKIVRTYKSLLETKQANHPWCVVFGNGYESVNGHAVLYIVDALTGALIRKIDTGVGGNNGLSTPAIVDIDNDDRADYVYAGDLKGNMWKFDLTDYDPANWEVAYKDSNGDPTPLFSAPGQPITIEPDVMYHCDKSGYLVTFGTGKFLGEDDRSDLSQQSILGIWDYSSKVDADSDNRDNDHDGVVDEPGEQGLDPTAYLGVWDRTDDTVSHISGVKLLEQTQLDWRYLGTSYLRTLSNNKPQWYLDSDGVPTSPSDFSDDGVDNDQDGVIDETGENIGNVGWFFDLPATVDGSSDGIDNDGDGTVDESGEMKLAGERVVKDVIIRDGKLIVISFIPEDSPCTGGGSSIVHEMDACSGSRLEQPTFDVNGDGLIDENDLIAIVEDGSTVYVPPTGKQYSGILHTPIVVGDPDKKRKREVKIFSSSAGTTEIMWEKKEKTGFYYWLER